VRHFAPVGASLVLIARSQLSLEGVRRSIQQEVLDAEALIFASGVEDIVKIKFVVDATVRRFGRLDILVANAGTMGSMGPATVSARIC
jgi:NADP-dependent 3-hydroxy acid dehydrogenase YdfG